MDDVRDIHGMVEALGSGSRARLRQALDQDPIYSERLEPIEAHQIAPRPWAYGRFLMFGSVSVLGGFDGAGKGIFVATMILCWVTGRALLGERVWRKGGVSIVSYEDQRDEWQRRIMAACMIHGVNFLRDVWPHVHFIKRERGRVTFGALGEFGQVEFPDSEAIETELTKHGSAYLVIDPWNHSHDLPDGNANARVAAVAGGVMRLTWATKVAGLVLHHLRKGANGRVDDLMGATALRATFRVTRILDTMGEDDAKKYAIADPWNYLHFPASKENYGPRTSADVWFRKEVLSLGNVAVDPTYPDGDEVPVIVPWHPVDAAACIQQARESAERVVLEQVRRYRAKNPPATLSAKYGTKNYAPKIFVRDGVAGGHTADALRAVFDRLVQEERIVPVNVGRRGRPEWALEVVDRPGAQP